MVKSWRQIFTEEVLNWLRYWILSKESKVRSNLKIFITDPRPVGKDFRDTFLSNDHLEMYVCIYHFLCF